MNEPHVLHARDELDLLNVVPHLIGFHPHDSLVLIVLCGNRVKAVGRADLSDAVGADSVADLFGPLLDRFDDAEVFAVAYSDDEAAAWSALDAAAEVVCGEFRGVQVAAELVFVAPGQPVLSYDPDSSALAAEATFFGVPVLPSRAALRACLEPAIEPAVAEAALRDVLELAPETVVREAFHLAVQQMRAPDDVGAREAALLALAAHSPSFAEAIVLGLERSNAEAAVALWTAVVRASSERTTAAACVLLGFAAWLAGHGALANLCLERAGEGLEHVALQRFLKLALVTALPPQEWASIRGDWLGGVAAA